jgi:hypothetical protein
MKKKGNKQRKQLTRYITSKNKTQMREQSRLKKINDANGSMTQPKTLKTKL